MSKEEYNHPFFDDDGKVICQLCGKSFMVISPKHLSGKHKIKYGEYKLRSPDEQRYPPGCPASRRYGKVKGIFDDDVKVEEMDDISKEFDGIEDPEIHEDMEVDIAKLTDTIKKFKDPMQEKKTKVLDHLRSYFSNIQQDYLVQLFDGGGKLNHEYITDFADPILKVNIEFPDVFWHNQGNIDLTRDEKLKMYGWKVVYIPGNNPTPKIISKYISEEM